MKTTLHHLVLTIAALAAVHFATAPLHAQIAGTLDAGFTPDVPAGSVRAIAVQPDGKILLGGDFASVAGQTRNRIARLNPDGTIEGTATFNPGSGITSGFVRSIAVQPDGKILIAGGFSFVNGQPRNCIARLNADGTVESTATFNTGSGAAGLVQSLALQPDGKILLGGDFTVVNGQPRNHIARLHADGTLESTATFNPGTGVNNGTVLSMAVQPNGRILLGGDFTSVAGQARNRIARLNADGSLESTATFNPGSGISSGYVRSFAVQPDGKILLGGGFGAINGQPRSCIARLHPDGTVESTATFNTGTGANNVVQSLALQPDGKILIGGIFATVSGQPRNRIARLLANGSLETTATFNAGTGANNTVFSLMLQPDGGILLGGDFTTVNGQPRGRIARLANDIIPPCDGLLAYEPIHAFEGTLRPNGAALLRHTDGSFYGGSAGGGAYDAGAIYRVTPSGTVSVLTHFTSGLDGGYFQGSLVSDAAGDLWGTTPYGGAMGFGTVFKVNAGTGALTTVASSTGAGASQPAYPISGLVSDGNGFFWGTSSGGGAAHLGTVFKISAATGVLSTVIEFTGTDGNARGSQPQTGLVMDGNGNFWGSTPWGGSANAGTIFRLHPGTGTLTTVVEFTGSFSGPSKELLAHEGFIWGTTRYGGTAVSGTVFKINQSTGILETVIEFTGTGGAAKGSYPECGLVADASGNLWGTTTSGGSANLGTIFHLHAATGVLATVVEFTNADGTGTAAFPAGGLTSDGSGLFWGTTRGFGYNGGMAYKVHATTGSLTKVADLGPVEGFWPSSGLLSDEAGMLWGTTALGGRGYGKVFKMHPVSGELTTVVEFAGWTGSSEAARGSLPGPLVSDGNGSLWGTTDEAGAGGAGTIFKVNTATGALTTVVDFFAGLSGNRPQGPLAPDGNGFFWGTTRYNYWDDGDPDGAGTIFKVNALTGAMTTVVNFDALADPAKGWRPSGGLVSDGSGNFWGTTARGGSGGEPFFGGFGTVLKVNVSTGVLTTVVSFSDTGDTRGRFPVAPLVGDGAGFLWGTTSSGGAADGGTIFKVHAATGLITTVHDLPAGSCGASLMRDPQGWFWGTTTGGANGCGTVFQFVPGGPLVHVLDFTGASGAFPGSSPGGLFLDDDSEITLPAYAQTAHCWGLYFHSDGHIYGTTATGGVTADGRPAGHGQIFRLCLHPTLASWRQLHFGTTANAGPAADLADPELDGIVNLAEFAFGLNPHQSSAGQLPHGQVTGSDYVITFPQPAGVGGITYGAEWSTTLEPGSWIAIPDTGIPPHHTFRVPIGDQPRFFFRHTVTVP